jgi:hypothetical protein
VKKFVLPLLAACAAAFVVFQVSAQEQPGISPADVAQAKSDFITARMRGAGTAHLR